MGRIGERASLSFSFWKMGRCLGHHRHDRWRCRFRRAYPVLKKSIYTWGNFGRITLPQVLAVNHWIIISLFVLCGLTLFWWLERKQL